MTTQSILAAAIAATLSTAPIVANAQDAIVPDDFGSISAAVAGAADSDGNGTVEIFVRAGSYSETFTITRSDLSLQGEDRDTTIILGPGTRDTIQVRGRRVSISGFTVTSGGVFDSIDVNRSAQITVEDNVLTGGASGVSVDRTQVGSIADNEVFGTTQEAINLDRCSRINVLSNFVHDNQDEGITIDACQRSRIQANVVTDNGGNGIRDRGSVRNSHVANQSLRNNDEGFIVEDSNALRLVGNTASQNDENGIRMRNTRNTLVSTNAFTNNGNYGVRREASFNDDWDGSQAGVQNPPGNNDLSGNDDGPIRED
jgi:parallel beta-helix repeat protein